MGTNWFGTLGGDADDGEDVVAADVDGVVLSSFSAGRLVPLAAAGGVVLAGAAAFAFPFFPPAPGESLEIFVCIYYTKDKELENIR